MSSPFFAEKSKRIHFKISSSDVGDTVIYSTFRANSANVCLVFPDNRLCHFMSPKEIICMKCQILFSVKNK